MYSSEEVQVNRSFPTEFKSVGKFPGSDRPAEPL